MAKRLPSRPNREHLRRQAKTLLAALAADDAAAIRTFQDHLPQARGMSAAQVRAAGLRLADAQSAIARQSGFASWPQLSRHVETLRALEGSWTFASLAIDGEPLPPTALRDSRILIDGDRFRTESPGAVYEGTFDIDVEATPLAIDIAFVAGPEAGATNRGIFAIDGDRLEICLDMNGRARPAAFVSTPGSGHAHEVLQRASGARPDAVTGGTASPAAPANDTVAIDTSGFAFVASPLAERLQGSWTARSIVRDGMELPASMCKGARRAARANEIEISIGGRTIIHALVRFGTAAAGEPIPVDYLLLAGDAKGAQQLGIFAWRGDDACFCMGAPGRPRPTAFTSEAGSGNTLSVWQPDR